LLAGPAAAQEPFSFVVEATPSRERTPKAEPLSLLAGPQLTPLAGGRWTSGLFTVLGVEDLRYDRLDGRQTRQTEVLVDLARSSRLTVAIGSGARFEVSGDKVLLTRVGVTGGPPANRVVANLVFERPLSGMRDRLDMITTAAWTTQIASGIDLGVEGLAKDLEGLWNPHESDGGARVFLGPSFGVRVPSERWAFHVTAGADLRASRSDVLQLRSVGSSFAMQLSATYGFR
jgi:hypothetical protein